MEQSGYYSRGKLLLSGEYAVLDGAMALAVPLKKGQWLHVQESNDKGILIWDATHPGGTWFRSGFRLPGFEPIGATDEKTAFYLSRLMREAVRRSPMPLNPEKGWLVRTDLEFDRNWGFGSSSSLISNVSWWLKIDPFELLRSISDGSGYDVFCARASQAITFRLENNEAVYREIPFRPEFRNNLYFVYLGHKQDSGQGISRFRESGRINKNIVTEISRLTELMIGAKDIHEFMEIMHHHESVLSALLGMPMVKTDRFPDFPGDVKSLGAWGGDFVMAATTRAENEVRGYFARKGLPVVFKYPELVYE